MKLKNKPQEMIKLYTNLTDYLNQQLILEKENPDQLCLLELNYKIKIYTVYKNFYIGLFYLTHKKFEELYTIMTYIQEELNQASNYLRDNKVSVSKSVTLQSCVDSVKDVVDLIVFVLAQTFVRMTEESKLKQQVLSGNSMDIDSGSGKKGKVN